MPKTSRSSRRASKSRRVTARPATASSTSTSTSSPSMSKKMTFFQLMLMAVAFVIVNAVVLYVANLLAPEQVVLGNHVVTLPVAVIMSSVVLSFIVIGSLPLLESLSELLGFKLKDNHMIMSYFILNTLAIWFISRFAEMLGVGLSSWVVAVVLGFILNLIQGVVVKTVTSSQR